MKPFYQCRNMNCVANVENDGALCIHCLERQINVGQSRSHDAQNAPKCLTPACASRVPVEDTYCQECQVHLEGIMKPHRREEDQYERVDHPTHYNAHPGGIECIDVIEHMTFNIGSAVKYLWRAGLKPGSETDEDLKKALWYIERERTIGERMKR